jgi:hypothetical protein
MSSLSAKDRVSLCSFTFSDGRRCRAPRARNHPHFCFYHAQKEARARAAETLGKDLAYFFSGDYLSACDLSTALARLIPAVVRGDVKPKTAHTVAYLVQTLMQAIHISQHEYINAFGTDGWRKSVRNSVKGNYDYRFPFTPSEAEGPAPEPEQPAPSALRTNLPSESPQPQPPATPKPPDRATPPQPAETPASCHSEPACTGRPSEESGFSSSPAPPPTSARAPQTSVAYTAPPYPTSFPDRSERSCLDPEVPTADKIHSTPATQFARMVATSSQPNNPPQTASSPPKPAPARDPSIVHFDQTCRLLIDGKPF